jgi:propanediol utilization protein
VSDENLIITFSDRYKEEYIDLVRKQIGEAIEKVRTNPKMSCRTKGQALADSFDMAGEVLVKVSNRHVHLSEDHVCVLFGEGHSLTPWKDLLQPGQYAAKEVVSLIGPKGRLDKVRVLGPTRPKTQVEISGTDQFLLGIFAPVKQSGDIEGSPGVVIQGPEGQVAVDRGVMRPMRHIHMTPDDGANFHVKDKGLINVRLMGDRTTVCEDVLVRITETSFLEMHVDTDEANAAGIPAESSGWILKKRLQ